MSKRRLDEAQFWPEVVDEARRTYNIPVARAEHAAVDSHGGSRVAEEVSKKSATFMKLFSAQITVTDLMSKKTILADSTSFQKRYHTVFRESGPELLDLSLE